MGRLWSEQAKFESWLKVEIAAAEAMAELDIIPKEAARVIREKARFDIDRIREIEKRTRHETLAFLESVGENVGPEARFIHKGMTSSDKIDTAQAVVLADACDLLNKGLVNLRDILARQAVRFKHTVMVGRTHGIHAEPTTLGLKYAMWFDETRRNIERLARAKDAVAVGKISGAVGTYSNIDPRVEELACKRLGLTVEPVSTQIVQRDRIAEYLCVLGIIAGSLEKMALEVRNLQRTDVHEVEEPFAEGQKGSSAMPHKKNPWHCERVCGMSRVVRGYVTVALEDIALWHERDMSHSSAERVILPDASIAVDFMIDQVAWILGDLVVYPDRMRENMDRLGGLVFSQNVLIAMTEKGMQRELAYKVVQRNSMKVWDQGGTLCDNLKGDPDITAVMSVKEIEECFGLRALNRSVDYVFKRVGLE